MGKLWVGEARYQGFKPIETYRYFAAQTKNIDTEKSIRWQDKRFKIGLAFFLYEVEYMARAQSQNNKAYPAKAKSFLRDTYYKNEAKVLKCCDTQRKHTERLNKLEAITFYHIGCDLIQYYAHRGHHRAKLLVEMYQIDWYNRQKFYTREIIFTLQERQKYVNNYDFWWVNNNEHNGRKKLTFDKKREDFNQAQKLYEFLLYMFLLN